MNTTTIDRRESYAKREAANRTPDYVARLVRGVRLVNALNQRFRNQDAGRKVCK